MRWSQYDLVHRMRRHAKRAEELKGEKRRRIASGEERKRGERKNRSHGVRGVRLGEMRK